MHGIFVEVKVNENDFEFDAFGKINILDMIRRVLLLNYVLIKHNFCILNKASFLQAKSLLFHFISSIF